MESNHPTEESGLSFPSSCAIVRGDGEVLPYKQIVAPILSEWLYYEDGAVLPYDQIVGPKMSERLYGGIGEKSIGYRRKVYRVFQESL